MTRSPGLCAQLAMIWEASARKPGNVHRYRDFPDLRYVDFLTSAAAVAPILDAAPQRRVGDTVLQAVRATRSVVTTNTNLGILLLAAPLAAVPPAEELRPGLERILAELDVQDARQVYDAIRLANPGGLGRVSEQDVRQEPTQTLRQVMALAADRDLVARQYANGFREVLDEGVPALRRGLAETGSLEGAIVHCQLQLLAHHPDSLMARKRGPAEAAEASRRARLLLAEHWPDAARCRSALVELDAWLGAEGTGRNPGTTADLVAASLFAGLRTGIIEVDHPFPWAAGFDHG